VVLDPTIGMSRTVAFWPKARSAPTTIALSKDGRLVAARTSAEIFTAWDLVTGKETWTVKAEGILDPLLFTPDSKWLLIGCARSNRDNVSDIRVIDTVAGKEHARLHDRGYVVTSLAITPDGKTLLSGYIDGMLTIWDMTTLKPRLTWTAHPQRRIVSVAITADGKLAASATSIWKKDDELKFWDVATGKEQPSVVRLPEATSVMAFSPKGELLAVGGKSRGLRLLDAQSGKELWALTSPLAGHTLCVAFLPDGTLVRCTSSEIELWDISAIAAKIRSDNR
jgi:WD40 repeat protein